MSFGSDPWDPWEIAQLAICVLTLLPSAVIAFSTLCLARRRKDPARAWCTTLKIVFMFFTV